MQAPIEAVEVVFDTPSFVVGERNDFLFHTYFHYVYMYKCVQLYKATRLRGYLY